MSKPARIVGAVALMAVVLVIASQWRAPPGSSATEPEAPARPAVEHARTNDPPPAVERPGAQSPAEPRSTGATSVAESAAAAPRASIGEQRDVGGLLESIDPLLLQRNLITRAPPPGEQEARFEDLEAEFATELADPAWSDAMEARILEQVSQVTGLMLTTVDAECRQTICRVKLFQPPGADAFSSLRKLRPIAATLGFDRAAEVATIGDDAVPIALLYFQTERDGV